MADDLLGQFLGPQADVQSDPLGDAIAKRERQRAASAMLSTEFPPDVAAQAKDLSLKTGMPLDTVARNLPVFQQQDQVRRATAAMETNPKLATWASDPTNAAIGADDMDQLAKNAAYWRHVSLASG